MHAWLGEGGPRARGPAASTEQIPSPMRFLTAPNGISRSYSTRQTRGGFNGGMGLATRLGRGLACLGFQVWPDRTLHVFLMFP